MAYVSRRQRKQQLQRLHTLSILLLGLSLLAFSLSAWFYISVEHQMSGTATIAAPEGRSVDRPVGGADRVLVRPSPVALQGPNGAVDPNSRVVVPHAPAASQPPPPSRYEGPINQDVHRFTLGPGLSAPLTVPIDFRLTWIIIGVLLLSNLMLIVFLGGAKREESEA